ncbi:hypothetical protein N7481_004584 [Penicillium waksmanii]|uniref:uncharacterized protein n=1 Tax=Penicillium waksmanii TaxID=69791 RepID=UPI0025495F57|nr:uncharacterized protein N7481_004584 [Penicillium waksmanii]KAJ5989374.1 hypothetical protein N7481_004584 [Penicillium waksmanii]
MLKPFQIRDLHGSSSRDQEEPSNRSNGAVQISAVDYDHLASTHPRARLSYLDDDDGDNIEVGSSLELSQRLDEPVKIEAIQISRDEPTPMHLFDIRRSNSITELWKRFEKQASDTLETGEVKSSVTTEEYSNDKPANDQAPATLNTTSVFTSGENPLLSGYEAELAILANHASPYLPKGSQPTSSTEAGPNAPNVAREESPPLMAAFEAELASLMNSTEDSTTRGQQTESSPQPDQGADSSSQRTPHPVEILAAQVLSHLANGANMVQSEFTARLPEMQRQLNDAREQLRDAQRTLPENVRMSLHTLLSTIEARMKIALGSLPTGGRQFAEEALHAGRPVAENAADGFRTMASDFNEFGKSLYAAFEEEFGRSVFAPASTGPSAPNTTGAAASGSADDCPPSSEPTSHNAETQPMDSKRDDAPVASQPPVYTGKNMNASAVPSGPENLNQGAQAGPLPWNLPPTRHGRHHPVPPPHPRPPPPPPYPGRWPVPGSFGHLFTTPHNHPNQTHPAPVATAEVPSRDADTQPEGENKTLFIGNVGFNVSEKMIQDVFASKGFIVNVDLPLDATSGKHAGFGYLHFPSKYPAIAAIDALQGERIDGYAINLEFSENTPIENVLATSNLNSNGTPHNGAQGSKQVNSSSLPRPSSSIKRQKSCSPRAGSPQLIDLSFEDNSGSACDSSRQVKDDPEHKQGNEDESFSNFNHEKEMSRFPPVSQLEAQHLAKHNQNRATPASTHSDPTLESPLRRSQTTSSVRGTRPLVHPSLEGLEGMRYDAGQPNPSAAMGPSLRRSSTMVFPHPSLHHPVSDDTAYPRLKRHASERHSLRSSAETDTWARLDRRERRRSRPSSEHSIPGSFPVEETIQPSTSNESESLNTSEIEACVSSLIDMGYGTAEEGGRSRMAVYAAASNGSLLDAIEMIEEERKVYAKHDQI